MSEHFEQHQENASQILKFMAMMVAEDDSAKRASYKRGFMHWFHLMEVDAIMNALRRDAIAEQEMKSALRH